MEGSRVMGAEGGGVSGGKIKPFLFHCFCLPTDIGSESSGLKWWRQMVGSVRTQKKEGNSQFCSKRVNFKEKQCRMLDSAEWPLEICGQTFQRDVSVARLSCLDVFKMTQSPWSKMRAFVSYDSLSGFHSETALTSLMIKSLRWKQAKGAQQSGGACASYLAGGVPSSLTPASR